MAEVDRQLVKSPALLNVALKWPRSLCASERGNTLIEFALIAPAALAVLLGLVFGGKMLWIQSALHFAVEEAARCASINQSVCGTTSQIQSFAAGRSGMNFAPSVFSVTTASCGNQVSASYTMRLTYPFTFPVTLTAQSCFPSAS